MLGSFIRDCILGKTGQHHLSTKTEVPTYVQTQKTILPSYVLKNYTAYISVYLDKTFILISYLPLASVKANRVYSISPRETRFMVDQAKE